MISPIPPAAIFIIGAFLVWFLKGKAKQISLLLIPLIAFLNLLNMTEGSYWVIHFLDYDLTFGKVDRLSMIFGYIFTIMSFIAILYALHVKDDGQHMAALLYAGSALGVVFAGDLLSLFIFWEMMAITATYLILARRTEASLAAGFRYLLVHVFGGVVLLAGIVLHISTTGSIEFGYLGLNGLPSWLILAGFALNAAVPPLHPWLTDAYPEATVTGAVFLSAFTTKTAIYLLIRAFPGAEVLVWLGAGMAVYGVVYAVLENDMRRLLAYHIISQVGYMVCGVGMGTALALNGSSAHAFAHILYKGLLFMGAGAIIQMTGKRKLTELGGLYKTMPLTLILYMIGGFSISALPLLSGFVSKSMVVAAAAQDHRTLIWLMLTLATAGTFLSTTLKLPYYAFFGKDSGIRASEPPGNMLWAMGLAALMCIGIGVYPGMLYGLLPYPVEYAPYTVEHVMGTLQILLFTGLGFMLLLKRLDPERTVSLDTDWFYRKGGRAVLWLATHPLAAADAKLGEAYNTAIMRPSEKLSQWLYRVDVRIIDGAVNGLASVIYTWAQRMRLMQSGQLQHYAAVMVLGLFVMLSLYLLF